MYTSITPRDLLASKSFTSSFCMSSSVTTPWASLRRAADSLAPVTMASSLPKYWSISRALFFAVSTPTVFTWLFRMLRLWKNTRPIMMARSPTTPAARSPSFALIVIVLIPLRA